MPKSHFQAYFCIMVNALTNNRISPTKSLGLLWLILLLSCPIKSQSLTDSNTIILQQRIINNDTLPHVNLKEVHIVLPFKFTSNQQRQRYGKLLRNVKVVLPYARSAGNKINTINAHLGALQLEKSRKDYLKKVEDELFNEFERPLRRLTYSQGRLLIKLINRETGDTTFELIKQYKGGVSAFFWQGVARLFGSNLKSEYDLEGDDKMIEHIILLIDNGML